MPRRVPGICFGHGGLGAECRGSPGEPWSIASISQPAEGTTVPLSPGLQRGPRHLDLPTCGGDHGAVMMCRPTSPGAMHPPDDTEVEPRPLISGPPRCLPQACACVAVGPGPAVCWWCPPRTWCQEGGVPGAGVGGFAVGKGEKVRLEEDGSAGYGQRH